YYEVVRLWDTGSGKELATLLTGQEGAVLSLAFSPDGKTLAAGTREAVKLWDTDSRKELATLAGHPGPVWSLAFSPDHTTLAAVSDEKAVQLWFAAAEPEVATRSTNRSTSGSVALQQ